MHYDFWDYFFGWLILAAFFIPFLGAIAVQITVFFTAMFVGAFGVASSNIKEAYSTVRIKHYDMDEDR